MGGIGSGRRSNRVTTDDCVQIGLPDLKRDGFMKRHCMRRETRVWRSERRIIAQLTIISDIHCHEPSPCLKFSGYAYGQKVDCLVWLESKQMPAGGERWYALCPNTGKRCTTLILPPRKTHFASVKGWGVAYSSQRECQVHRAYRAIDKAERKLKTLSKYARTSTRNRLLAKINAKQMIVDEEMDRLIGLIRRADRLPPDR